MDRIQKILAAGGIASRRAAEKLITEGRVRVNGRVVSELGAKADPRNDRIEVDGKRVVAELHVYLVLHKPRGVVATMSDPEGRPTVAEILTPVGARVYPVGRLDFATSGVLLATNDGDFADGLLHPKKAVPKTYIVKVNGKMAAEDMDRWRQGVRLEDGMTAPAEAKTLRFEGDKTWFELTIKEGRNQQIRRMGEATGFPVMRLARVAFGEISADGLRPGQWRHLTRDELSALKKRYGVPRSIPTPPELKPAPARRTRSAEDTRPRGDARARGGDARARGNDARGARGADSRSHGASSRARGPESRGGETRPRGPNTHARGPDGRSIPSARAPGERPGAGGAERDTRDTTTKGAGGGATTGPRYGGGAPGRRGYDVTEDWGGGARRGSSSGPSRAGDGPSAQQPKPFPDLGGGRGGRTRTTGTSGGIGTSHDADRVKGRRPR